jgi:hypothetical protein
MKTNTTLSRRLLLAGAPAAAALAVPTAATAISGLPAGPDAELLGLGRKLAPLVAEANAAKGVAKDDAFWPDLFDRQGKLLDQIFAIQPTTKKGLAVHVLAMTALYDDVLSGEETSLELPPPILAFLRNVGAYTADLGCAVGYYK